MPEPLAVAPVESRADLRAFVRLPYRLHRGTPWVPPLESAVYRMLDEKRNPLFQHATARHFLARRGAEVVGRVSAIENRAHNEFHGDKTGFFGFFECRDDREATAALLGAAGEWLRGRGLASALGPASPSANDEFGILSKGFERAPGLLMPWSPPYYGLLLESAGFRKARDLYAWEVDRAGVQSIEKVGRIVERVRSREELTIRDLDLRHLDRELPKILAIYNQAWEKNWCFVPMTDAEVRFMAEDFVQIADPRFTYIAEAKGKPVALMLTMPNVNPMLSAAGGRLFPLGWLRALLAKRHVTNLRVVGMGIIREYQRRGIESVFYWETLHRGMDLGYQTCEMSWVLEDNALMNRSIEAMGAKVVKEYRVYEKGL